MSVRGAAFLGIGAMVGAGIFALLGEAGAVAGSAVWMSLRAGRIGKRGPSGRRLLAPLALAQFICSFAGSNMNVVITDISRDLETTVEGAQATITAMLLVMAVLMIPRRQADRPLGAANAASSAALRCSESALC